MTDHTATRAEIEAWLKQRGLSDEDRRTGEDALLGIKQAAANPHSDALRTIRDSKIAAWKRVAQNEH